MRQNIRQRITPSLPGDFSDTAEMQRFNNLRKFSKGYRFATIVGSQEFQNMQFPGSARLLLGFTLVDTTGDPNNLITININQEDIITSVSWAEYTKQRILQAAPGLVEGSSFNGEYFIYLRGLSGSDAIKISYNAVTGSGFLIPTFYFKTLKTFEEQV